MRVQDSFIVHRYWINMCLNTQMNKLPALKYTYIRSKVHTMSPLNCVHVLNDLNPKIAEVFSKIQWPLISLQSNTVWTWIAPDNI